MTLVPIEVAFLLKGNERRALALVALVLVSLTGCTARPPDVEPDIVLAGGVGQQVAEPREASDRADEAATDNEEEATGEAGGTTTEETRPSMAGRREQLSEPAQLDEPAALGRALAVFYRMRSRAFMAPVARHVQGAVNLGGIGGDRETRRCPGGGVFHLEWQGDVDTRSGSRELLYRFEDCRGRFGDGPLLVLNGHYRRNFDPLAGSEQVHESFDIHGVMGEERKPVALEGSQRIERPSKGGVVRKTGRMEMLLGETYMAYEQVRDEIVPEAGESNSDFASFDTRFMTTLKGRLFSSELGGWVELSTVERLVEQQAPCSASGVVRLKAQQRQGQVRFGPHTGTRHRVALELDGGAVERYEHCSGFGDTFGFGRPERQ